MPLTIDNLTVAFDERTIIEDLSLTIGSEEIVAILGPSGCGKTTLLRTIAGLQNQTAGTIVLNDAQIQQQPCETRGIGMLFQRPVLFPFKDVLGNILFAYKRKKDWNIEDVDAIMGDLGLEGKKHQSIETLSGGEA